MNGGKQLKIFLDNREQHILIKRMTPYFEKFGHSFTLNKKNCDVQLSQIKISKKTNKPIVLRLDGIYYDKATKYKSRNRLISISHSKANSIIYQSYFSKKMCEVYLKRRTTLLWDVIYNGIEKNWCGEFKEHDGINIIVSGKWRRHKRLKETIDVFLNYLNYFPMAKLHILGKPHNNILIKHPNIIYYGMVNYKKMAEIYQTGDFFIHLSKKDSCPNAVVEVIGSGMPVITTNACGGSTEICKLTKGCIICKGDNNSIKPCFPYSDEYNKLPKKLYDNLIKAMIKLSIEKYRVDLPDELNIESVTKKYINILEKTINNEKF